MRPVPDTTDTETGPDPVEARVPEQAPAPSGVDPALLVLAERVQATVGAHGLSLSDPDTAVAFRATLDVIRLLHTGARETGVVDDGQHGILAGMVDGAYLAPDLV